MAYVYGTDGSSCYTRGEVVAECDPLDCYALLERGNLPAEILIAQIIYTESAL